MKTLISTNLQSFIELLEKVHICQKEDLSTCNSKISIKNEEKIIYCECCELSVSCCSLKFSSGYPVLEEDLLQYEEIICIDEDNESLPYENGDSLLHSSIENVFVMANDSTSPPPQNNEKDPLLIESEDLKNLYSSVTHDKQNGVISSVKIIQKLVDWTSDSIEISTENKVGNNRQKYPKTLICEYCGTTFEGKDRIYKLFYHRNKVHTKRMQYKCPVCNRTYWGEREFSFHLTTHSNPGSICEVCGIQFARKQDLLRHGLIHDHKKFVCKFCSKEFRRRDNLKVHERLHTGHFPFICQMCGSGFPQKQQLTLHFKKCPFSKIEKTTLTTALFKI